MKEIQQHDKASDIKSAQQETLHQNYSTDSWVKDEF